MPHEGPITGAILAGGRASRLGGADKSSLLVGGRRILERQVEALHAVTRDVLIVAGTAHDVRFDRTGLRVVHDRVEGAGALGGIYTALTSAAPGRVIVLACDLPFVTGAWLARLIAEPADAADAVVPRGPRGLEPLCAVYATAAAPAIAARIARGALRAAPLEPDLRVREIAPEVVAEFDRDGLLFANVNTPHDYERARAAEELRSEASGNRITEPS
ncbi:MAG TPA: molybdenum cofactor guanylyltransferase [Vicinamibacterales bacterium]|nr:molybdenum cofactor guanylyltransferase [Vicinamibacterales bacterium]